MTRFRGLLVSVAAAAAVALGGRLLCPPGSRPVAEAIAWQDLTLDDALHDDLVRTSDVAGHVVHYPTPTEELAAALVERRVWGATWHLAEARRRLGDAEGAREAMERWAQEGGAAGWAEAARWASSYQDMAFGFQAVDRAARDLEGEPLRRLLDDAITWAEGDPEAADALVYRARAVEAFPDDPELAESYVRALEAAGRIDEAAMVLERCGALADDRQALLRSRLFRDGGAPEQSLRVLDGALGIEPHDEIWTAFASAVDEVEPEAPDRWHARLDGGLDGEALPRLTAYMVGYQRGGAARDLLLQVERRGSGGRDGLLMLSRLHESIGGAAEAFRLRLAAASLGERGDGATDLAELCRLALRASREPLAFGTFNDEAYRWVARIDRTPGLSTGGLSFLLTGQDWNAALTELESQSLADRTFLTARYLLGELMRRAPEHPRVAELVASVMERHVERGEAGLALALLPLANAGSPDVLDRARAAALLSMRSVERSLAEESGLWSARLDYHGPTGGRPFATDGRGRFDAEPEESYADILRAAVARLDERDPSHRGALLLLLAELDRHADDEELWLWVAERLEGWHLDDDLGPRYQKALRRFRGSSWWARLARWYMARQRNAELADLAEELVGRFRGAQVFARLGATGDVTLPLPEPGVGAEGVRLVSWADWVRLEALRRFPHNPTVYREAERALVRRSAATTDLAVRADGTGAVLVDDALIDARRWAVVFADAQVRSEVLAAAMTGDSLESWLEGILAQPPDPARDTVALDGLVRLSRFEEAAPLADRLCRAYPGNEELAAQALALHRSLSALDPREEVLAAEVVRRTVAGAKDPATLWMNLGELEEDLGRPEPARAIWSRILAREPRSGERVEQVASALWDYGHMAEARDVIVASRARLDRPTLMSFEMGVLSEEVGDVAAAIDEYLRALAGDLGDWTVEDRAARRLGELLARADVRDRLVATIDDAVAGDAPSEQRFARLLPLGNLSSAGDLDEYLDAEDLPRDPVGREQRDEARRARSGTVADGLAIVRRRLRTKAIEMATLATSEEFLLAIQSSGIDDGSPDLSLAALARRAQLAPLAEERLDLEVSRALLLEEVGRNPEAERAWATMVAEIADLEEGATRMRAQAAHAAYVERSAGVEAAARAWEEIQVRYPNSLGILEDHVAFLERVDRQEAAREVLQEAASRAVRSHRRAFLERVVASALRSGAAAQAAQVAARMLAETDLELATRLRVDGMLVDASLTIDRSTDTLGLAARLAKEVPPEWTADVYRVVALRASAAGDDRAATHLWIEALKRRLDRDWIRNACVAAERAGLQATLLGFFETQQAASPRDVRWAVAVRDIRLDFGDLAGALDAARAAVRVRPEKESLWHELTALLVRAGRPLEAARELEVYARPRLANEAVAAWRSDLFLRGNAPAEALRVERECLDAFARVDDDVDARGERASRAAWRLHEQGHSDLAWALLASDGDLAEAGTSHLDTDQTAELALAAGHFVDELEGSLGDEERLQALGRVLRTRGRSRDYEEVMAFVLARIGSDPDELEGLWTFLDWAWLRTDLQVALVEELVSALPPPWPREASATLLAGLLPAASVRDAEGRMRIARPAVELLVLRDLARNDDWESVGRIVAPRWQELEGAVLSDAAVDPKAPPPEWTAWLGDGDVMTAFCKALGSRPGLAPNLARMLGDRRSLGRMHRLGASRWSLAPLVATLDGPSRARWMIASGEVPDAATADLAVLLGDLLAGEHGTGIAPGLAAALGPRELGALVSAASSLPGGVEPSLFGDRPADPWLVLEAMRRMQHGDPTAALVPLESTDVAALSDRVLLTLQMARAVGNRELLLEIDRRHPEPRPGVARLGLRVAALQATRGPGAARAAFEEALGRMQPEATLARMEELSGLARASDLPDPWKLLDRSVSVGPEVLAEIYARRGVEEGKSYRTDDIETWRTLLAERWADDGGGAIALDAARFYVEALWSAGSGELSARIASALPEPWPQARDWLDGIPLSSRAGALAALDAFPDVTRLRAMLAREQSDASRMLRLWLDIHGGHEAEATATLRDELAGVSGASLADAYDPDPWGYRNEQEDMPHRWLGEPPLQPRINDAVERLKRWLEPFRATSTWPRAAQATVGVLSDATRRGPVCGAAWALLFDLEPEEERAAVVGAMERAYLRGDLEGRSLADVAWGIVDVDPATARLLLERWDAGSEFADRELKAWLLQRSGSRVEAARLLADAGAPRTAAEDRRAFEAWIELAATLPDGERQAVPDDWREAVAFVGAPAGPDGALGAYLERHPYDELAARAALRTSAAAEGAAMARATMALTNRGWMDAGDRMLLDLRRARGMAERSTRAARTALGAIDSSRLARAMENRGMEEREILQALSEVARIDATAGDARAANAALAELGARSATLAATVERDLTWPAASRVGPLRVDGGVPRPWLPRDLRLPLLGSWMRPGVRP